MNKLLIATVGLPRSGKSTWCLQNTNTLLAPIVNPDSIRLGLHGQAFIGEAEEFVWAIAKVMVRSLFIAGHNTILLDATNTTIERRRNWIFKKWETQFKVFSTSKDICIQRAGDNESLIKAIERMDNNWEPLIKDEQNYVE